MAEMRTLSPAESAAVLGRWAAEDPSRSPWAAPDVEFSVNWAGPQAFALTAWRAATRSGSGTPASGACT